MLWVAGLWPQVSRPGFGASDQQLQWCMLPSSTLPLHNSTGQSQHSMSQCLPGDNLHVGGGFSSAAPKQFGYCAQQLAEYADLQQGAYWREVELAVSDAMQIFGFVEASTHDNLAGHRNLRELDLGQSALLFGSWQSITKKDATSGYRAHQPLSRHLLQLYGGVPLQQIQQAFQHQQQVQPEQLEPLKQLGGPVAGPAVTSQSRTDRQQVVQPITPDRSKVVIFDIDETVLSNMQQILSPEKWPWDKWVAAAQAPALDPVQQFYRALCAAGYSVAFVTGRREAQRDHTTRNLATAGYGTLCTEAAGSADSDSSGAHGNAECCYTALYMRPQNDTRLASVYKPWARQKLLSAHKMQLLALVGDQFSDLNGGTSAPFAFKLPNPFYYIL